jgi:CRP/FNR family cyclic AMP-dependent transcriptional regulator
VNLTRTAVVGARESIDKVPLDATGSRVPPARFLGAAAAVTSATAGRPRYAGRMAGSSSYLKYLAEVPLFSACSNKELQKIAKASDEIAIEAGRVLVEQDGVGREAYVVIDGEASVKRGNRRIASMGPGDHFGELALLDGGPRTATVVAETPMKVLVLGQREFAGLLDEVPGLAHKILANLASQIRELDKKIYP